MSVHSTLEVSTTKPFDLRVLERPIKLQLDEDGLSHDVFLDLQEAFSSGEALVGISAISLLSLIEHVHTLIPEFEFSACGVGEEPGDMWVRQYGRSQSEPVQPSYVSSAFTRSSDGSLVRPLYRKLFVTLLSLVVLAAIWQSF